LEKKGPEDKSVQVAGHMNIAMLEENSTMLRVPREKGEHMKGDKSGGKEKNGSFKHLPRTQNSSAADEELLDINGKKRSYQGEEAMDVDAPKRSKKGGVITKTQANLRWGWRAGPAVINETMAWNCRGLGNASAVQGLLHC
jgi:hypothetical protein